MRLIFIHIIILDDIILQNFELNSTTSSGEKNK